MFAYLDPGTGSLALQMSVASLLGAMFVMKGFSVTTKTTAMPPGTGSVSTRTSSKKRIW